MTARPMDSEEVPVTGYGTNTFDSHHHNNSRGPSWKWVVGLAGVLLTLILGVVVKGVAQDLAKISEHSEQIAVLREQAAQNAEFRKEMRADIGDILDALANANYKPARHK